MPSFIESAQSLIGTKYAHQGRSVQAVDCVGLVLVAAQFAGIISAEDFMRIPRDYSPTPNGELVPLLHQYCTRLPSVKDAEAGDLLAVKYRDEPQHLMIVERATRWGPYVIHAIQNEGVIHHLCDENYLRSRNAVIHAAFRFKEDNG